MAGVFRRKRRLLTCPYVHYGSLGFKLGSSQSVDVASERLCSGAGPPFICHSRVPGVMCSSAIRALKPSVSPRPVALLSIYVGWVYRLFLSCAADAPQWRLMDVFVPFFRQRAFLPVATYLELDPLQRMLHSVWITSVHLASSSHLLQCCKQANL